jgi:hypothetical protein
MTWQSRCGDKLVTPEQAISLIKPTATVYIAGIQSTPYALCQALIAHKEACAAIA